MKKQIKFFVVTGFLCMVSLGFAQSEKNNNHSLLLGFHLSGGNAQTEASTLIDAFDPIQVKNSLVNSWSPSLYLEQRLFNSFAIHLGVSYMNHTYSYLDKTTTNYGFYDAFTNEYTVKHKAKFVESEFGISKLFFAGGKIRPYVALNGNISFMSADSVSQQETKNNTSYETRLGFSDGPLIGISPEIGVIIPTKGKGSWVINVKQHYSLGQLAGGKFASINMNFTDANYSAIETVGNYFHVGIGYQIPLSTWETKDKKDKQAQKALKEKESEERRLAKKDEEKQKQEEKKQAELQKEQLKEAERQAKLEEDQQKEEDKLKTDASGKPKELKGRSIKIQEEFEVTTLEIELSVWDDGAEIDGDSIMIFFNGDWIATDIGLTKEKQKISITLDPKEKNYLIVYAINEGIHAPNTAAVSFYNGTKEVRYRIHSKINENGAIRFKYKDKK